MLGAIMGDVVGSPYATESTTIKTTEFPMFGQQSHNTNVTLMIIAIAEGVMNGYGNPKKTEKEMVKSLKKMGAQYQNAEYSELFARWLQEEKPKPYLSDDCDAAVRAVSIAWLYNNLRDVERFAELSARVTHTGTEAIKGAMAVAASIFLARQGASKEYIKRYLMDRFRYDFSRTIDQIRSDYQVTQKANEVVPEAITAFLSGNSFEECVRIAISFGGNSTALGSIAGEIAEAFYDIPQDLHIIAVSSLDNICAQELQKYVRFLTEIRNRRKDQFNGFMNRLGFFKKKQRTNWCAPKSDGEKKVFPYPCYGDEVDDLVKITKDAGFADYFYEDTLRRYDVECANWEAYRVIAPDASVFLLRAMLMSISNHEKYVYGAIAEAVRIGAAYEVMSAMQKKMTLKQF